jgi:hypothetical protein
MRLRTTTVTVCDGEARGREGGQCPETIEQEVGE